MCDICGSTFNEEEECNLHMQNIYEEGSCYRPKQAITIMPKEGRNIKKFTSYEKCQRLPFVIYADFESNIIQTNEKKGTASIKVQDQKANSICWYEVSHRDEEPHIHEEDSAAEFLRYLSTTHCNDM